MKSLITSIICLAAAAAFSQSPPKGTVIGEATKLIVATPFDQPAPPTRKGVINGWQAAIGEWTVKDGVMHGDELEADHHASSCTWRLEAMDMILTAQFRLGKAEHVAFGCRDTIAPNHHLGRTFISKDGIWIQRMSGIAKTTKAVKLKEIKTPVDPEAWHDLTVEIIGDRYRAQVDGHVVEGTHERFKDAKGIVALIVKGQGAQFKNVNLWHAKPKG
ncbi:family 16 glycoside hydrolase [Prosthecobacter sp. SYSU 5D2]|uniref:family 16 glycoside hydrolase n=1 Tax=Prosthecobacter sp. SYSU 5D2 TaxID=3134134 RepID=UPI0031FF2048